MKFFTYICNVNFKIYKNMSKKFISLTCPYCGRIYDSNNSKNPKTAMFKHNIKCKSKHQFIEQFH